MSRRTQLGLVSACLFVGSVWFANWLLTQYGVVPVGFHLHAPAGVFAIGGALILRDLTHRTLGRLAVIVCILAGCLLAYVVENGQIPGGLVSIPVASALAFLFSEGADMAIYTPIEERNFLGAVVASNTVGAVVDSALFLWLAFGSAWIQNGNLLAGQVWGKLLMTAAAFPILYASRRRLAC